MSTETFSPKHTFSVLGRILPLLVADISPHGAHLIDGFIRKSGHVNEHFILSLLLFRAFRF